MRVQHAKKMRFFSDLQGGNAKKRVKNEVKIKTGVQIFGQILLKIKTPQRNLADLDLKGGVF